MSSEESDMKRLDDAVERLGEHFDTVQIFATRHEPEEAKGTITVAVGSGNFFAREGQVREWLMIQDERCRIKARKDSE